MPTKANYQRHNSGSVRTRLAHPAPRPLSQTRGELAQLLRRLEAVAPSVVHESTVRSLRPHRNGFVTRRKRRRVRLRTGGYRLGDVLTEWMERYIGAWNSNDPDAIGALFTDNALYYTEPFTPPWRGRAEITERWLARKDEPGQAMFEWRPLVVTPEVAIITGTAIYKEPPGVYSNLWVLRLDPDGRCREFTEWWMLHPAEPSSPA